MNRILLLGITIGTLEVALIAFLTHQTYTQGSWWGLGLLAYLVFCIFIGAGIKSIIMLAATGFLITVAYIKHGFAGALIMYLLVIAVTEIMPKIMNATKRRLGQ